ncbi:hypothetical protein HY405_01250 [Candidatus Microgenomates bacterium]|nr:hypothetical protein [Candidatus Microgenomates bacterium]
MDNVDQKFNAFIEGFVTGILAHPSLQNLTDEEKQSYAQKLRNHFFRMVVETLINRLTPEQVADVQANIGNPAVLEQKIEEYAATVPGLSQDIEGRLGREFDQMHKALENAQP